MNTTSPLAYAELLQLHQPSMPTNDAEHQRLVDILESIELDGHWLTEAELLFCETVTVLVLEYEERVSPMPKVDAREMLHYLTEEKGMRQADFVSEFGSRSRVNQIFRGKKPITKEIAEKLAKVLGVSLRTFLP